MKSGVRERESASSMALKLTTVFINMSPRIVLLFTSEKYILSVWNNNLFRVLNPDDSPSQVGGQRKKRGQRLR